MSVPEGGGDFQRKGGEFWGLGFDADKGFAHGFGQLFEPDVGVGGVPGASRDEVAHDDVFFEAFEAVHFAQGGGVGENAGGVLEAGGADEAFGLDAGFGDAKEHGFGFGRFATGGFDSAVFFEEDEAVNLVVPEEGGVAGVGDFDFAQHLADDDFDVFVVNFHALEAVNFLDFVEEVFLEGLGAADVEHFVGDDGAFGELAAFFDVVAFEDDDVFVGGDEVFFFVAGLRIADDEAAFATEGAGDVHDAVDFGDFGGVFGSAGFEEFGDAGEAAGDVFGFNDFARGFGEAIAGFDECAGFGFDVGAGWDGVGGEDVASIVGNDDLRMEVFFVFDHDHFDKARGFVGLAFHGDAFDDVYELDFAGFFGEDRDVVGVPFDENDAFFGLAAVFYGDGRADDDVVAFEFAAVFGVDGDGAVFVEGDVFAVSSLDGA